MDKSMWKISGRVAVGAIVLLQGINIRVFYMMGQPHEAGLHPTLWSDRVKVGMQPSGQGLNCLL